MGKIWIKQINYNTGDTFSYESDFKTLKDADKWIREYSSVAGLNNVVFKAFEKDR